MGTTPQERAIAYQSLLAEALSDDALQAIRNHLQRQRALGLDDFRAMVQAKTNRFANIRPAHRLFSANNRRKLT